jgi:hypothetical protein
MHSALYIGQVRHRRFAPSGHAFLYRLFMAWLDLAELDTVFRGRWMWSTKRPALCWLRRADYLGRGRREGRRFTPWQGGEGGGGLPPGAAGMKAGLAIFIAVFGVAAVLAGCGGGAALGQPPPCVSPTPTPGFRGTDTPNRQLTRLGNALTAADQQIDRYLADFRARWPENRNYRSAEFREDFVVFAGQAACAATAMQALTPPASAPQAALTRETALDAALDKYLAALAEGRDALETRNTSKYRDWAKQMDAVSLEIDQALNPPGQ